MSGEKILVVDDSEPVRMLLESTLRGAGYAVRCADGGEAALRHCREWLPDLVLLDVLMPGMDGHMTAIEIKFDERLKDTPLLFLSADLSEESRSQGLGLGAEAYVTKPFEAGALLAKVGGILRPLGEAGGPDKDLAGS
jgi:DNA-binding response OmpR family regulator